MGPPARAGRRTRRTDEGGREASPSSDRPQEDPAKSGELFSGHLSDPPGGPVQHASKLGLLSNEYGAEASNYQAMAALLIALGSLWTVGLLIALTFCRVAAAGDRDLRSVRVTAHQTHEFGLLG